MIQILFDMCDSIHYKMVGNLSYEQFKAIYRDLWYAKLYPSMKYKDIIRSNCSQASQDRKPTTLEWWDECPF